MPGNSNAGQRVRTRCQGATPLSGVLPCTRVPPLSGVLPYCTASPAERVLGKTGGLWAVPAERRHRQNVHIVGVIQSAQCVKVCKTVSTRCP